MENYNLKDLDVQEIDAKMSKQTNGGLGGLKFVAGVFGGALLLELVVDGWAQCKADFLNGWHSVQ